MSVHKGNSGLIKVGSNAIAEIKSYSLEESADTIEVTKMGDGARGYLPSLTSFSGSIDAFCVLAEMPRYLAVFSMFNNRGCIFRFTSTITLFISNLCRIG